LEPHQGSADERKGQFDEVVENKHKWRRSRLKKIADRVHNRFDHFEARVPSQLGIWPMRVTSQQRGLLVGCYSQNVAKRMREEILKLQEPRGVSHCQYCGLAEPKTLDHYLPSSKFSEFSVHFLNLVPCCFVCNDYKGESFSRRKRLFVNLYYDTFIQTPVLSCRLDYSGVPFPDNAPAIRFEPNPANVTADHLAVYKSHFDELKLAERFVTQASTLFGERHATFQRSKATLSDHLITAELLGDANDLERNAGPNYFEVPLYRAMANSVEFLRRTLH
jgi:5-methylcytosine-specific restriction endonuclease McrA